MSRAVTVPDVDLRDYADARGLSHRGQSAQIGFLAAMPMSEELQFNVLRGPLPGGEEGIVFHDVKIVAGERAVGMQHMTQIAGSKQRGLGAVVRFVVPLGDAFEKERLYKFPHTTAAIRLPEASGLVVGLMAGRQPEQGVNRGTWWYTPEGEPRGWQVAAREQGDRAAVQEIVSGPLTELLAKPQPLGFAVNLRWGTLSVSQAHFATEPEKLDELCEKASWLAQRIRAICERHTQPLGLGVELPEPHWLADVRKVPAGETSLGLDAQNLGGVVQLADETGMALEDAFAFMRGFAYLPFPGEAYGVLRGTLPGSDVTGRVVVALERPAWENKALQEALDKRVGGPFGCDTVLVAVPPATPETPGSAGEQWIEGGRVAVRRGVLAAWRKRERMSPRLHEVERLVEDTLKCVHDRGLVC